MRDFINESLSEKRRVSGIGEGVTLATVHGAKGTEHDHVLIIGDWSHLGYTRQSEEEERRTLYVGHDARPAHVGVNAEMKLDQIYRFETGCFSSVFSSSIF